MASLDARGEHDAGAGNHGRGESGHARQIAPLYKRLPPGPHRLQREQVLRHQRRRMQGAMVEAVASTGYQATSVKQLIGLAGVSRRSFYEQFANKQECFLTTFDLLARRTVTQLAASCECDCDRLAERLRPPVEALARSAEDTKAMRLVLEAPPQLGLPGIRRLCQASAACERMLGEAFAACADADSLPPPVLRAVAGGVQVAIVRHLDRPAPERARHALARELLDWLMLFAAPSTEALRAEAPPRRRAAGGQAAREIQAGPAGAGEDIRARLLAGALQLAAAGHYGELTGPRIADEAGVPIDAFFASFAGPEDCFRAAVEDAGDGVLRLVHECGGADGDWPGWLRRALGIVLRRLAERPLHARSLVELAFLGGERCASANLRRVDALAGALTAGAPGRPLPDARVAMIAAGMLAVLRGQTAIGRLGMLPLLSDQLAYFIMAPCIGSQPALAALGTLPSRKGIGRGGDVRARS